MKETGIVYVRMDKEIKENAEAILSELGISASAAVQMFYKCIIREQGMPLDLSLLSNRKMLDVADLTDEELFAILDEARQHAREGKVLTLEQSKKLMGIK